MPIQPDLLRQAAQSLQPDLHAFAQKLLQTPSLPGQETAIARLVQAKMQRLGYHDVSTDRYGNVIGLFRGGDGPTVMLNGHLDHVDPGDEAGWPHPPFGGRIADGVLWGRGAVDMKGPLACMLYAPHLLRRLNLSPPGDVYVAAVVMEEAGGIGTSRLVEHLHTDWAIVGEPSRNTLRRGHRGRGELWVTVRGKSVHASVPHLGVNPHYALADFLRRLPTLSFPAEAPFGASSVAPTLYRTDQRSPNVTPGQIRLTLDWRNIPAETPEEVVQKVNALLQACLIEGTAGSVELATRAFTTYTGLTLEQPAIFPSFVLPADHPRLTAARRALSRALGRDVPVDIWPFATDGGHLMAAGIPTIGFGPGDERLAHTNREHIPLSALTEALIGYAALILGGGEEETR